MPPARDRDGPFARALPPGECLGTELTARQTLGRAGVPSDRIQVRAGWFHDTFTAPLPSAVCYLHVDADWYDSVLLSLRTFYPLVSPGGVIVLDDFGWWEGAMKIHCCPTEGHHAVQVEVGQPVGGGLPKDLHSNLGRSRVSRWPVASEGGVGKRLPVSAGDEFR